MTDEVKGIGQQGIDTGNGIDPNKSNKFDASDSSPIAITLMKIDETLIDYIAEVIKPTIVADGKIIPVPVLMGSAERWKTVRKDGYFRDNYNKILKPLIMLRRVGVRRNPITSPVNKYLQKTFVTGWNKHNSYDKFNVQNKIIPSRQLVTTTIPDYIDLDYEFILWTDLIEQMNSLIETINFENQEFWGRRNSYKFRVEIQEYSTQIDLPAEKDRIIRTSFNAEVKAYLLPKKGVEQDNAGTMITSQKVSTIKKTITSVEIDGIKTIE